MNWLISDEFFGIFSNKNQNIFIKNMSKLVIISLDMICTDNHVNLWKVLFEKNTNNYQKPKKICGGVWLRSDIHQLQIF